jgi:hypothetical protein
MVRHCIEKTDNEFAFVRFFSPYFPRSFGTSHSGVSVMFVFDRSAATVLLPIALLIAVVLWSGRSSTPAPDTARAEPVSRAATVARTDAPRSNGG